MQGELLSVNMPDGTVIGYVHDPLGRRIAKKVNGVITEKYLWNGLTTLLAVYDGSDNLLMRFEYADGRMPVAMSKDGVKYYLAYDQVGSLKAVADAAGNVVRKIDYDSFGNIIEDTNLAFAVPFGFAGGLHDRDTGLVRFGYRDYDPDVGRWTAKDPILFDGGNTDLYGYCVGDPVNLVDPGGLFIRHLFEDKLPSWLRDNRRDSERESAHQDYNKDIDKRLEAVWETTKIVTLPEKTIFWAPIHTIDKITGDYPDDSYFDPWHHHYNHEEDETNSCP